MTQPEQILEEQLVAQLQKLGYGLVYFSPFKAVEINRIKNLTLKMFTEFKKGITFVPTVPVFAYRKICKRVILLRQ